MANDGYRVMPRDKVALFVAVGRLLAGAVSRVSFEGDLRGIGLDLIPGASVSETQGLKRQTLFPIQDFIVLPLNDASLPAILNAVLPERRLLDRVIHVQIERNGDLQFGAYDNFDPGCVWCGGSIPVQAIAGWLKKGIIRASVPTRAVPNGSLHDAN